MIGRIPGRQGRAVSGPGASTDSAVPRFNAATGKLLKNSALILDDSGNVTSFGGNIKFPASQAASADANTLDDYEEGTFTPSVKFGGAATSVTYSAQIGHYVKIGNRVFFNIIAFLSNNGSGTGGCTIDGLPFTSINTSNLYWPVIGSCSGSGAVASLLTPNTTTITMKDKSFVDYSDTTISNTENIIIGGSYET